MSKRMYHPCHKLSVPSAKLFWCRHCMQMFEDAITRWKHSRTCKGSRKVTDDKDLNGQVSRVTNYSSVNNLCTECIFTVPTKFSSGKHVRVIHPCTSLYNSFI